MVIVSGAIKQNVLSSLEILTTGTFHWFIDPVSEVVLPHEAMSSATLEEPTIDPPRSFLEVGPRLPGRLKLVSRTKPTSGRLDQPVHPPLGLNGSQRDPLEVGEGVKGEGKIGEWGGGGEEGGGGGCLFGKLVSSLITFDASVCWRPEEGDAMGLVLTYKVLHSSAKNASKGLTCRW